MSAPPAPAPPPVRPIAIFVLVVSLLTLAGGTRGLETLRALSGHPEVCAFRARHGVECLGCGGTRAFGEAARGRFHAGFRRNPIGAMTALLFWLAVPASALAAGLRRWWPVTVLLLTAVPALSGTLVIHAVRWWYRLPAGLELW